ncbi:hypothetical protein C9374_011293 [Naegleria lovaniensis]|uniref:Uncharacterized protein n=1 Tax=Naegleria lovaniensis TaxID=51637 RepID=A0AA88GWZ8_NAELO|nr:uncharacterized protein C9374_011293 [Naegleria lovaniensis]KAG2392568.1 hypothetical protein C9374_011293 [Naegleria lovaniensis]
MLSSGAAKFLSSSAKSLKLHTSPISSSSALISLNSFQHRNLNNWTWGPTKDYENQFVVGKAPHSKRKPAKKFYKWTPNPAVPKKEIEEHNAKVNTPGTKKPQVISERNKEHIQRIYAAAKEFNPQAAIEAYHRCSHGLDVRAYSALIKSMEKEAAHIGDAFQIYNDMRKTGKKPNLVTFSHLVNVCINANHVPRALYVLKEMMISKLKVSEKTMKQANTICKKLIKLCYANNEPGRVLVIIDAMRSFKSDEVKNLTGDIPIEFLQKVVFEDVAEDKRAAEAEKMQDFWIGVNKALRPSFTAQTSATLPISPKLSYGLEGKTQRRAHFEAELRKLQRLAKVDADNERNNKLLDFDEHGISTRDYLEARATKFDVLGSAEHGDMDESLKISYNTLLTEFSHILYSTVFNDRNYRPCVDKYSETTESLAVQYTERLKKQGFSERDIAVEVSSFKDFAEAHNYINNNFIQEDGSIELTDEYLQVLNTAINENWTLIDKPDHQIVSMIPTVVGASPQESAILLAKPVKNLLNKFIEAESMTELEPIMDEYKSEMSKATRYVNRKVDWIPVVLGVDGRPFFPSEDIISIDKVTTETIENAKQAYINSIKDEEVKKQIKEEFYDYIHLIWIDNKGRVVEGISY